jgi:hypothetical protein
VSDPVPGIPELRRYVEYWQAQANQPAGPQRDEAVRSLTYWREQLATAEQAAAERAAAERTAAAPPVAAPQPAAPPSTARRTDRLWTPAVIVVAALCVVGLVAVHLFGVVNRAFLQNGYPGPSAADVTRDYLDALVRGDQKAADRLRSAQFADVARHPSALTDASTQLIGDAATRKFLHLSASYEIVGTSYGYSDWDRAYLYDRQTDSMSAAAVRVRLTWHLTVAGKPVTVSALQTVELLRAFYYRDLRTPQFQDDDSGTPKAVSPWMVTGFTGDLAGKHDDGALWTSTFRDATDSTHGGPACRGSQLALAAMLEAVRTSDMLSAECAARGTAFAKQGFGPGVQRDDLHRLEGVGDATLLPELLGVGTPKRIADFTPSVPSAKDLAMPFAEYVATTTSGEQYVFAVLRVQGDDQFRFVSVTRRSS